MPSPNGIPENNTGYRTFKPDPIRMEMMVTKLKRHSVWAQCSDCYDSPARVRTYHDTIHLGLFTRDAMLEGI